MTPSGSSPTEQNSVVDWLLDPASHPEQTDGIEHIETHISHVFLTDRHAYKLKKPLDLHFLDFTTLAAREQACREEVRLNRRLAPQVYLGVEPICRTGDGRFCWGVDGEVPEEAEVIDWVVKMVRLPQERTLDHLIRHQQVKPHDLQALIALLGDFYERKAPRIDIKPSAYRQHVVEHVQGNREGLLELELGLPVETIKRVHTAQLTLLNCERRLFEARAEAGRIVDGHGDLRPEHVVLTDPPAVFDCIEFNEEFRQIDIADELAFLVTECEILGAGDLGQWLMDQYCQQQGDCPVPRLVHFYQCYRACVRAKVDGLRAAQQPPAERGPMLELVGRYLELANKHAGWFERPLVLIISGTMGSGKSTLARGLAAELGLEHLQSDAIRQELFERREEPADYGRGIYGTQGRAAVYGELLKRGQEAIQRGLSVVLDASFLAADRRREALALANAQPHATALVIHCTCPDAVAVERMAARLARGNDASEGRPDLLAKQRQEFTPDDAGWPSITIETTQPLREQLDQVFRAIGSG